MKLNVKKKNQEETKKEKKNKSMNLNNGLYQKKKLEEYN